MDFLIVIAMILLFLIVLVVCGFFIIKYLREKFKELFGVDSLQELNRQRDFEEQHVQKSVSSMTKFYLPNIQKDFPDFNWEVFKMTAQNVIKSTLLAISTHNAEILPKEVDSALKEQVSLAIQDDKLGGIRTRYDDIQVYNTQIVSYKKTHGTCVIVMESSVGLISWQEKDGNIVYGSNEKRKQTKYTSSMVYIQDIDKVKDSAKMAEGLTCPQCGAPISSLGVKFCEYCGAGVVEYIRKVWRFSTIKES